MLESQKFHEQGKASLCPAVPSRRWGIYQIPQAFYDMYLAREMVVLGSQPSWHMGPMEKKVWNQRSLVRIPVGTEVGRKARMEGEEGAVGTHPLEDLKWASLVAEAWQILL